MLRSRFNDEIENCLMKAVNILSTKGKDYSGDLDVLQNFKKGAASFGVNPDTILMIFADKHWQAIKAYAKTYKLESEPIEGRIIDVIAYMVLLYAMVKERDDKREERSNHNQDSAPTDLGKRGSEAL